MSRILPKQINNSAALTGATIVVTADDKNVWSNQSTDSLLLPAGTTTQRPSLNLGQIRYNTQTSAVEFCVDCTLSGIPMWDEPLMLSVVKDAKSFTGFADRTQTVLSFDDATRTLTLAPVATNYEIYYFGQRIIINTPLTITIPNVEDLYYFYLDGTGTLQYSTASGLGYWPTNVVQVAAGYWEETTSLMYPFAGHRRGMNMSADTYTYIKTATGPLVASGLNLTNYTTTGAGALNSDAQISITNGVLIDGDITIDISNSMTPGTPLYSQPLNGPAQIPMLYLLGANADLVKIPANTFPLIQNTTTIRYNLNTGGSFSLVDATDGYFVVTYIFATEGLSEPIFGLVGDQQYATLSDAEAHSSWAEYVVRNGFQAFTPLLRPLYTLIYQTSSTYTNTPHARLVEFLDNTAILPSGRQIDHSNLIGLDHDDHLQYVNVSIPRTITAQHTFAPLTSEAPFLLGTNAQDQLVVGFNADYLDGYHASYFQPAGANLTALSNTATTGLYVIAGSGTSSTTSVTSTAGTLTVTDGSGTSGNINIDMPIVGTPVSDAFVKITTDTVGRVTAEFAVTSTDIISTLGYTPLNKAGDTMTGALNMGGNQITNLAAPSLGGDATNKTYVDSIATGLLWQQPVQIINLISDAGGPPVTPQIGDSYIIGTGENTGVWSGFNVGDVVEYQPSGWTFISAAASGDRYVIDATSSTIASGSFTGYKAYIVQITGGTAGAWTYSFTGPVNNYALTTNNPNAFFYGDSYTYSNALAAWVPFAISIKVTAGGGLYFGPSTTLNVGTASSSRIVVSPGYIDLATTGVTPGTYAKLTVDAYGRITVGAALASSDVTTALGYTPQQQNSNLTALANTSSTGIYAITGSGTSATRSIVVPTGMSITNADGVAGNPTIALTTNLLGIENVSATGLISYTGLNTFASRSIVVPSGMSITNADGVAGNPTIALAGDLAGLEGLTTTGFAVRTGSGTWVTRSISGQIGQISISPIDGVAGNVMVSFANIPNNTFLGNTSGVAASPVPISSTGSQNVVLSTSPSITTPSITGLTTFLSNGDLLKLSNDTSVFREGNWAITPSGGLYTLLGDYAMNYWTHNVALDSNGNFLGRDDTGPCTLWVFTESGLIKIYTAPSAAAGTVPVWTLASTEDTSTGHTAIADGYSGSSLTLNGSTSGAVTIQPQAIAGTYNFNLPITAGTAGQVLTSQGGVANAMTWTTPIAGVTSITGTANQITASSPTGAVTLSLPSAVTTGSLTLSGLTANSFLYSGTAGLLTTTTASTNGQLLIGSTGAAPVATTLTAGSNISITNAAGSITISSTGLQTALQLYNEHPITPLVNTVTGNNAVTIGEGNVASGQDSIVLGGALNTSSGTYSSSLGMGTNSTLYGQIAHANGEFAIAGDAQASQYVLRNHTAGSGTSELFLDGTSSRLVMRNNTAWIFKIYIVARRTDATGDTGAWEVSGVINRDAGAASTALIGNVIETILSRTNKQISINITADIINGSLKISVTNTDAAKSYNWVARVDTVEVS